MLNNNSNKNHLGNNNNKNYNNNLDNNNAVMDMKKIS